MSEHNTQPNHDQQRHDVDAGGGDGPDRLADGAAPPRPAGPSMGLPVTPHAQITKQSEEKNTCTLLGDFRFLLAGFDTLDLGLYVEWSDDAFAVIEGFESFRTQARGTDGVRYTSDALGEVLIKPGGRQNYRYHLHHPDMHLWFAKTQSPERFPNVYVSPSSRMLWQHGIRDASDLIVDLIREMGGSVIEAQVSRADPCVDYNLQHPPTLDYLDARVVCRSNANNPWRNGDALETYYRGKKASPLQARIYNKMLEVLKHSEKQFFVVLWGGLANAWRVEFQCRRPTLKKFGINTIDDLVAKAGPLWQYLTDDWFSLRDPAPGNTSRRPVTVWWQHVQGCAEHFGYIGEPLARAPLVPQADAAWYLSHFKGLLPGYAARRGCDSIEGTMEDLAEQIYQLYQDSDADFFDKLFQHQVRLGIFRPEKGGDDAPF